MAALSTRNVNEHEIPEHGTERLARFVGDWRAAKLESDLRTGATWLRGRRIVNVTGNDQCKGGVYEILRGALPYLRGAGIDTRWVDLPTRPDDRPALEFFHVLAHGTGPSKTWLQELPKRTHELRDFGRYGAGELASFLLPTDLVLLHDTQTAPTTTSLESWHDQLVWHAHVGTTSRNRAVSSYWDVMAPSVARAKARVFYRREFAPDALRPNSVFVTPAVDPAALKSAPMPQIEGREVLTGPTPTSPMRWTSAVPRFSPHGVVGLQISRWDLLKDMPGAVRIFGRVAEHDPLFTGLVVGPNAQSAAELLQLNASIAEHAGLEPASRSRVHVGVIKQSGTPDHDHLVRALQSSADVVIQRSRQEGFGLTVTEAMLRGKPVIATAVGGIPLQLEHERNGILMKPSASDFEWETELRALVRDGDGRRRLGAQARRDALDHHVVDRQLTGIIRGLAPLLAADRAK